MSQLRRMVAEKMSLAGNPHVESHKEDIDVAHDNGQLQRHIPTVVAGEYVTLDLREPDTAKILEIFAERMPFLARYRQ